MRPAPVALPARADPGALFRAVVLALVPALFGVSTCMAAVLVPADTELVLELTQALSSKSSRRGDPVALRLAEPLQWQGQLLIPAGAVAAGDVVHADRAKAGGQAGELVFAARYLLWNSQRLPLRATQAVTGRSRTGAALGVAVAAGLAGFLVRGGEIEVPEGSLFRVKLRGPALLPAIADDDHPPAIPAVAETTAKEVEE